MKNYYEKSVDEVLSEFKTSKEGLTNSEVEVRLKEFGKNALIAKKKKSFIRLFFEQMKDLMIIVLLLAALISAVLAIIEKNYLELIDGGIILLIVIINSIIGVMQEQKADKSMELLKNMNKPFAKVLRNGEIEKVKSEDIVVGDIIILEAGDSVPADLRIIESASLKIEESSLTGESLPVSKEDAILAQNTPLGDRKNMAFSSTTVSYGRGKGVVVATGMNTEVGHIANMLNEDEKQITPLQGQLNKTAKMLSILILGIAIVIFVASLIKNGLTMDSIVESFMTAVAIAVAAIPEGLSAVVTIVLAIGVKEMSKNNAIVKHLPAVETLGCCQVICSDKTGTLTMNKMTVKQLYTLSNGLFVDIKENEDNSVNALVNGMVLCNDTTTSNEGTLLGDPTETALVQYLLDSKIDCKLIKDNNKRIDEIPFDSVRKLMTTINKNEYETIAYIKGAVDKLLVKCNRILDHNEVRKITSDDLKNIESNNKLMADKALRVLAFAINDDINHDNLENNLIFVGLTGMIDPPRKEVHEAVKTCESAGMKAVMITGDHLNTAVAIAKDIGIFKKDSLAITGEELDKLSDEEFKKNLSKYAVFARVSPENKVRIVRAYKSFDLVVAMTGDGVNDAPSIKNADVGVGMGITGTDVSKEASDIVLADDNFATIIGAVKEGRKVYANIQKVIKYLLSANIAEVLCLFITTLFMLGAGEEFLTPVMILWINLVTDSLPALSLAYEEADNDIMRHKPRDKKENLMSGRTGIDIIIQGLIQTGLTLGSYSVGNYLYGHSEGMMMAFITLSLIQLFHAYNSKSTKSLFSKNPFKNRMLNLSFVVGIILMIIPTCIPGIAQFFMNNSDVQVLSLTHWLYAMLFALAIIPLVEIQKFITNKIMKSK